MTQAMKTKTVTLPFELYECIVSQAYAFPPSPNNSWRRNLEACALVSKDFKYISYPYLFKSVVFVFVEKLDGEGDRDVRSFPIDVNGWKDRSFYRYVTSTEDIVSYLSGRSTIPSCIRKLSLRGDHPQLSDTGIRSFSYEELVHILGPLKRLQHLSLFGVVADANPSNLRPILSSLPKLIIDYGTFAYLKISSTQLYSACALFGDIGHLILSLQLHCPPIRTVTIANGAANPSPFRILEYLPTHFLRALHLPRLITDEVASLSHLLARIGSTLEFLSLGELCLTGDSVIWDNVFPSTLDTVSFDASVNLRDIGITVHMPYEGEIHPHTATNVLDGSWRIPNSFQRIRGVQRVIFQTLPPSVKTLRLSLLCSPADPFSPAAPWKSPPGGFWEVFVQLLVRSVSGGVERVELTTIKGGVVEPCTEGEQELLKSYFPSLVRDVLVFP
ncbi:hypothetical protein BC629DRAFT_1586748 [Irpex lacteus]|nr:hypothetical protein BC629DRAFT_1586748 [Irpex lacteus]